MEIKITNTAHIYIYIYILTCQTKRKCRLQMLDPLPLKNTVHQYYILVVQSILEGKGSYVLEGKGLYILEGKGFYICLWFTFCF